METTVVDMETEMETTVVNIREQARYVGLTTNDTEEANNTPKFIGKRRKNTVSNASSLHAAGVTMDNYVPLSPSVSLFEAQDTLL